MQAALIHLPRVNAIGLMDITTNVTESLTRKLKMTLLNSSAQMNIGVRQGHTTMDANQKLGIDSGSYHRAHGFSSLALVPAGDSQQAAALLNCSVMDAERQLRELAQLGYVRLKPTPAPSLLGFEWCGQQRDPLLEHLRTVNAWLLPEIYRRAESCLDESPLEQWTAAALRETCPPLWALLVAGRMCRRWLQLHDAPRILNLLGAGFSIRRLRCANVQLCAVWALVIQQQFDQAERCLVELEQMTWIQDPLLPLPEPDATMRVLRMWLNYYRDSAMPRATRLARLESCMESPTILQPMLLNQYAVLQYSSGNVELTRSSAERAAQIADRLGNLVQYQLARGWLMAAQFMLGNGLAAWLQLQFDAEALQRRLASAVGPQDPALACAVAIHQGCQAYLCYEANQIQEAQVLLGRARQILGGTDLGLPKLLGAITQAKLYLHRGDFDGSEALLCALNALPESQRNPRIQAILCYERMRTRLRAGRRADDLIEQYELQARCVRVETLFQDTYQEEHLYWLKSKLVAFLIDEDAAAASEFALKGVIKSMGLNCRRHLVTFYLLKALSEYRLKRELDAIDSFNQALLLCQNAGYRRVLVDDGTGLWALWLQMRAQRSFLPQLTPDFLQSVHVDLQAANPVVDPKPAAARVPGADRLLSLTDKEIEILALLAEGLCNKKIAHRASIALTTVKWHLQNIFSKLEARNRTEAVLKAQEMHLVDSLGASR